MGSPSLELRESLYDELKLGSASSLVFRVGGLTVRVPAAEVAREPRGPSFIGADLEVEAVLPASVLQRYEVVLDYGSGTMTLANPGMLAPHGNAAPFRINRNTGILAVEAVINGRSVRGHHR